MYAEELDDEEDYASPGSPPHLLLFGQQVAESIITENSLRLKVRDGEVDAAEFARQRFSTTYRVLRFFKSVEGFHKGSLDLTGRHEPRYIELQARWSAYLTDFLALSVHAEEFTSDELDWNGVPYADYRFKDAVVWEDFRKKWKVPSVMWNYGTLLSNTESVLRYIAKHPLPQIQKLCLVDLPTEILNEVFEHALMNQARLLSATCRWLNDIGRRYIFRSRRLAFDFPLECWKEMREADDRFIYLEQLARLKREQMLSSTNFLLNRPDLVDKMNSLAITDQWSPSALKSFLDGGFDVSAIEDGFYTPIYDAFMKVLATSFNLTSIKFHCTTLMLDFIRCIANLPKLHTLVLTLCQIPDNVQEVLEDESRTSFACTAFNLQLMMSDETMSLWHAMLFCPHLRTLSADSLGSGDMYPPELLVFQKCSFFPTLAQLSLSSVGPNTLHIYYAWFVSRPAAANLTHFKLQTRVSVSDGRVLALLTSLRAPSLRILALEGLAEAEFRLFDGIARRFPELIGLTLIRRASNRQTITRSHIWPHPAWEYARHLQGLPLLQHFGWNYDDQYNRVSSASMLRFEEGFYDNETDLKTFIEAGENYFFDDDSYTPKVFGLLCPSLETYTCSERTIDWCISRTADRKVSAHWPIENRFGVLILKWNPGRFGGHWPYILPKGREQDRDDVG